MLPTTNENIMNALDEYVFGHQEAKKALIVMLARSKLRYHQKYYKHMGDDFLLNPLKVLLIGSSGTGKTHLLESLRKIVHFPLVRIDATHLNPTGAGGGIKPEDLKKMINQEAMKCCLEHPELYGTDAIAAIDKTVVFVDEIDKLGSNFESGSSHWNAHTQSNFLTIFDNKTCFAGVSFVFAGAFSHITQTKIKKSSIGFGCHSSHDADTSEEESIDERIVKGGLLPELVGRINTIVELDVFNEKQLYKILTEVVLPKKQRDLAAYFIFETGVSKEKLKKIAKDACKSGQGVRYLQRAIDKIFLDIEFDADATSFVKLLENDC